MFAIRRSLLVLLSVALPIAVLATAAAADSLTRPRHARTHGHAAYVHRYGTTHHAASAARRHHKPA